MRARWPGGDALMAMSPPRVVLFLRNRNIPVVKLSKLISQRKDQIIGRWSEKVMDRLGLETTQRPQLINALPDFLDELAEHIDLPPDSWVHSEGAASHGRHRVEMGLDIGGLAEEFSMVTESILEEASEQRVAVSPDETAALARLVGRGTAESVRAYASLRDRQLAEEAARHFSFIAHELRTPLHTARLVVHLLANDAGDRLRLIERLQQAHDQLVDLVDNSLMEARLQGERKIQLTPQRTHALIREAIANCSMLAVRRNIEVVLEGDDLEIMADRKVMVSALTNLLVNGVKFSHEGSGVTIRSRSAEDRVLIEIDDGCGGLPDDLPARLFQPFVQASSDRSGFGLGLVIVKQAVEAHAGAVRVINLPPNGCRLVVELQAARREQDVEDDAG
jgi:signal transduction histidine kinase